MEGRKDKQGQGDRIETGLILSVIVEEHEADHLNNRLDAGRGKDVEQVGKHFHSENGSKEP